MTMTPITTTARLNEQTGMVLAYYGYDRSKTNPADLKATLGEKWVSIDSPNNEAGNSLVSSLGTGYNLQHAGGDINGTVENSFSVFINQQENQIAISFKGSDATSNWISDFANGGASEFAKIQSQAQVALETLQLSYPDFQIIAVGHSLGGGMAQSFAVRNGLDAQIYNSLPIANGTISGGYFVSLQPAHLPNHEQIRFVDYRCAIHAYVLMTHHVHLLVTPQTASGLAKRMQSLGPAACGKAATNPASSRPKPTCSPACATSNSTPCVPVWTTTRRIPPVQLLSQWTGAERPADQRASALPFAGAG